MKKKETKKDEVVEETTKLTLDDINGQVIKVTNPNGGRVYKSETKNGEVVTHLIDGDIRKEAFKGKKSVLVEDGEFKIVPNNYVPETPEIPEDMVFAHRDDFAVMIACERACHPQGVSSDPVPHRLLFRLFPMRGNTYVPRVPRLL